MITPVDQRTRPITFDVPHNRSVFGIEAIEAVRQVVASGYVAGGPRLAELEKQLARRLRQPYAVGVGSGLSALRLSLKALGVGPGSDVLVPAYSCVALANAVLALGGRPVAVEVSEGDWNIDLSASRAALTTRTKAVVAVNTFGIPAPIEKLLALGLPVIEDASHGIGLMVNGHLLGGRGTASIVSFYATKFLGGSEGGAVLTSDPKLAQFVESWRHYADQPMDATRLNDKMTDLSAALVLCQLNRLSTIIKKREAAAMRYHELLQPLAARTGAFHLPNIKQKRVWYRYALSLKQLPAANLVAALHALGIQAERPVTDWRTSKPGAQPKTTRAYESIVSLPFYADIDMEKQEKTAHALERVIERT